MNIIIEQNKPFSQSVIWSAQREYFVSRGAAAWAADRLPFYATSNTKTGEANANVFMSLLRDAAAAQGTTDTVYILELGAGHGRFSYYFLWHLTRQIQQTLEELPNFCYIISDISEKNLNSCMSNPKLKPFIESGTIDFCLLDIEHINDLQLRNSGKRISGNQLNQPLFVVSNYMFDVVPQDLFYKKDGVLHNVLITTTANKQDWAPEDLSFEYQPQPLTAPPYQNETINSVFNAMQADVDESYILFPHKALQCLDALREFSTQGTVIISADKFDRGLYPTPPQLVPHGGSFSLSVSYKAFAHYAHQTAAQHLSCDLSSLTTQCLIMAKDATAFPRTRTAFNYLIERNDPCLTSCVIESITKDQRLITFSDLISLMKLSSYDPYVLRSTILPALQVTRYDLSASQQEQLCQIIPRYWEMDYPMDNADLAYELGALLFNIGRYGEALEYLKMTATPNDKSIMQDILFCYYKLEMYDEAMKLLQDVKSLETGGETHDAIPH